MQYVCDAGSKTWFRLETEAEAERESREMEHAVAKYFSQAYQQAVESYVPPPTMRNFEQKIGLKSHIQRAMPLFLTLRDNSGLALATAMLPPGGRDEQTFRPIVVGNANSDPYPTHADAIATLGKHYGIKLDPARSYPYRRG